MPGLTYLGKIFHVTEEYEDIVDAVITKGSELSQGQRLYFESADFEVQGGAILERHENLSPNGIPERLRLDNILLRHRSLNYEQAASYKDYMLRAGFTYPVAIAYADTMIRKEGVLSALSWLETMAAEMEKCNAAEDDYMGHIEDSIPPTYGFHKIDNIYAEEIEMPWMLKQPELVRRLITTPERCKNLEQLRNLGKACYEANKAAEPAVYQTVYNSMSNVQRTILWDAYNKRKREIMESIPLSPTAKALVKRITGSRKNDLPRLKANLVRLQKGQIRVRDPPSDEEWEVVWWYWGKHKQD